MGASAPATSSRPNYGEKTYTDERGRTVRFIPAKLADNPYINPEYAADLKALPERLRRAFLDGDWSAFAGPDVHGADRRNGTG